LIPGCCCIPASGKVNLLPFSKELDKMLECGGWLYKCSEVVLVDVFCCAGNIPWARAASNVSHSQSAAPSNGLALVSS
jgi:hypothetical protein